MVVGRWDEHKPESIDELSQRTANHDNESRRIGKDQRQKIKLKLTGASILSIDAGEEPAFEEADPNLKGKGETMLNRFNAWEEWFLLANVQAALFPVQN